VPRLPDASTSGCSGRQRANYSQPDDQSSTTPSPSARPGGSVTRIASRGSQVEPAERPPRIPVVLSDALAYDWIRDRIAGRLHAPAQIEASAHGTGGVML
jgi:hypothetical protein